jgi:hypothetical protein
MTGRLSLSTVMPALVAGILVFGAPFKMWKAGIQACESTPSFGRLCPAMTMNCRAGCA